MMWGMTMMEVLISTKTRRTKKRPPDEEQGFLGAGSSSCKGWAEPSLKSTGGQHGASTAVLESEAGGMR